MNLSDLMMPLFIIHLFVSFTRIPNHMKIPTYMPFSPTQTGDQISLKLQKFQNQATFIYIVILHFTITLTAVSCATLFAMSDLLWYRMMGRRFNARKTAAIPSTTRSHKCCQFEGSTTAGSIYV